MQVTVQGILIDFEVRGEGTPVLLIRGWSCDRRYMPDDLEPVFDKRQGWRRIYLDLPGHGKTPAPEWLSNQAQMLVAITAESRCIVQNAERFESDRDD